MDLTHYLLRLLKLRRKYVRFVILSGSRATRNHRTHSDYDVAVVLRKKSNNHKPIEFCGAFKGKLLTGWILDPVGFKADWVGGDDENFVWRREQIARAKLLFGKNEEFRAIVKNALRRRWNLRRELAVIKYSYVNIIEYTGKMLDAAANPRLEFYRDAYLVCENAALFLAGINRINLQSENTMYQQIMSLAEIRPPNFEHDFLIASGFAGSQRSSSDVLHAIMRIVRWLRTYMEANCQKYESLDKSLEDIVSSEVVS